MRLHVHYAPTEVVKTVEGEERWCFGCRERTVHVFRLHRPVEEMSYYGPHWSIRCSCCERDAADFPGLARRWVAPDVWEWAA